MLKLTDSGCAQHHPLHITFTGLAAALVGRLIFNLPPIDAGHTYICEHGHTHCLTLQPGEENVAASPPRFGLRGNTPLNH